jgi:hypothetical protein
MAWSLRTTAFAGVVSSWGVVKEAGVNGGFVLAGQLSFPGLHAWLALSTELNSAQ